MSQTPLSDKDLITVAYLEKPKRKRRVKTLKELQQSTEADMMPKKD